MNASSGRPSAARVSLVVPSGVGTIQRWWRGCRASGRATPRSPALSSVSPIAPPNVKAARKFSDVPLVVHKSEVSLPRRKFDDFPQVPLLPFSDVSLMGHKYDVVPLVSPKEPPDIKDVRKFSDVSMMHHKFDDLPQVPVFPVCKVNAIDSIQDSRSSDFHTCLLDRLKQNVSMAVNNALRGVERDPAG